jgi:hypothetical protein
MAQAYALDAMSLVISLENARTTMTAMATQYIIAQEMNIYTVNKGV